MVIRLSNGSGKHIGKYLYFLSTAVVLITFCIPVGLSVENPSVRNPAGLSTVPHSSLGGGLIDSYNPIDTSGNLIVTGNVRRGSHFRGNVPYRSTASFSASLGTSALSSFLRDSANSGDIGAYSGGYRIQPYYSAAETVTTMSPGNPGVLRPLSTRIDGRSTTSISSVGAEVSDLQTLYERTNTDRSGLNDTTSGIRTLPGAKLPSLTEPQSTPLNQYQIEQLLPGADLMGRQDEQLTNERQQEQTWRDRDDQKSFWDPQQYESYLKKALDEAPGLNRETSRQNDSVELKQQDRIDGTIQTTDFGPFGQNENMLSQQEPDRQAERNSVRETPAALDNFPSEMDSQPEGQSIIQTDLNVSDYGQTTASEQSTERRLAGDPIFGDSDDFMNVQSSNILSQTEDMQNSDPDTYNVDRRNTLEQIQRQLDVLIKSVERASLRLNEQKARNDELIPGLKEIRLDSPQEAVDRRSSEQFDDPMTTDFNQPSLMSSNEINAMDLPAGRDDMELPRMVGTENTHGSVSGAVKSEPLSDDNVSIQARDIMGTYTSLDSFSEAKFKEYYRTGRENLSAGRYYRAASAFTLASMYKPEDPLSLAGKGHALFAAGDYVSSALFISRALELDPGYIRTQVDLTKILGGDQMMETRISDVEEWLARSGSEQLSFLLGYICYRTDRIEKAKLAIDLAFDRMPQSIAILAVKTAIDQNLTIQK